MAPIRPAFFSGTWPVGRSASGILTYCQHIASGLQERGEHPAIVFDHAGVDAAGPQLPNFQTQAPRRSLFRRVLDRCRPRAADPLDIESEATRIARGVELAQAEHGIGLFEMEESFGIAGRVAELVDVPVIIRLHGPAFLTMRFSTDFGDEAVARRIELEAQALQQVAGITSPAADTLREVQERHGPLTAASAVIPNPAPKVDVQQIWDQAKADADELLFVGRFDYLKGADTILRAFALARQQRTGLRLRFVGPGETLTDPNGGAWSREEFVREFLPEHAEAVTFTGALHATQILELRRQAAMVLIGSRYENFPYAALEAFAQGCPVVAPRVGGLPEIVSEGESGMLFESADPAALAASILRLIEDPAQAAACGAGARAAATGRLSLAQIAPATLDFYRTLVDPGRRDPGL